MEEMSPFLGVGTHGTCQQSHTGDCCGQGHSYGQNTQGYHLGVLDLGVFLKEVPLLCVLQPVGTT